MGRLTKRTTNPALNRKEIKYLTAEPTISIYKLTHKLGEWEDLEEQGRLIELPCLPNETVWVGHEEYSFDGLLIKIRYKSTSAIITAMQDGFIIGRTKEEAEAKLAELGGKALNG